MRFSTFSQALLLSILLGASGCATLFSGTDEPITFNTVPTGATVIIDGIVVGETPLTIDVDRPGLEDKDVTVELDGHPRRTFELDKEFNTVAILNILFWPGFIVDALTGALYRYDKTDYTANLENGRITLQLDELKRGDEGQYILPNVEHPLVIEDPETGLQMVFR